uniref:DeoRC domain-containing protein n=1 Tax=Caenorhabditis tropicalis TaxID=1561998 RepID=A0A1I7UQK0_9PELO
MSGASVTTVDDILLPYRDRNIMMISANRDVHFFGNSLAKNGRGRSLITSEDYLKIMNKTALLTRGKYILYS